MLENKLHKVPVKYNIDSFIYLLLFIVFPIILCILNFIFITVVSIIQPDILLGVFPWKDLFFQYKYICKQLYIMPQFYITIIVL